MDQFSSTNRLQQITTKSNRTTDQNIDFSYNFRLIHFTSRVFGLMPFSIVQQANGYIEKPIVTIFDFLWFSISIFVYLFGIYSLAYSRLLQDASKYSSKLGTFSDNMIVMLGLILCLFAVLIDFYNRSKLVHIMREFINFDKKVEKFTNFFLCATIQIILLF